MQQGREQVIIHHNNNFFSMQDAKSEIMQLLNGNDSFDWDKAVNLMRNLRWTKRKRVEALAQSLIFRTANSPYKIRGQMKRIKRTLLSALSKRQMRPRILFGCFVLPITIKNQKPKLGLTFGGDEFGAFMIGIIKNNFI
jgi:hypothetical protein